MRYFSSSAVASVRLVTYAEWTGDGLLRHVVYLGEREDKPAKEVVRERPK
jgi:bifunctional non-homologous end joining protein LigD